MNAPKWSVNGRFFDQSRAPAPLVQRDSAHRRTFKLGPLGERDPDWVMLDETSRGYVGYTTDGNKSPSAGLGEVVCCGLDIAGFPRGP